MPKRFLRNLFSLSVFAFLVGVILVASAYAQTVPTFGETAVGEACGRLEHGTDFDTLTQCNTANPLGGLKQKAPLFIGKVTSPPYATTDCDAEKEGMVQWDGDELQVCDGSAWNSIEGGGSGGTTDPCSTPSAFSFIDQIDVAGGALITSNSVALSGVSFTCPAIAVCVGCTTILRNGVPQGTSTGFVSGDSIAIQLLSSETSLETVTATVTVGNTTSAVWSVTTNENSPKSFSFTDRLDVPAGVSITSNTVTLEGDFFDATAICGSGCTAIAKNGVWGGTTVTGFNPGDNIVIQQLSSTANKTATTATVSVSDTTSGIWSVTTMDNAADAFSFDNQTGVTLSTKIKSNTVTLEGGFMDLTAMCGAGCTDIYINDVWKGTTATGINSGDTIAIEQMSSDVISTNATAVVSVGSTMSDIWFVKTNNNSPDSFQFTNQTDVLWNSTVASDAVTLTGIFFNVTATCGTGCINIARNGVWGGTTVTGFSTGDTIAIRQTAADSGGVTTAAFVTVESTVSGRWDVTTISDRCLVGELPAPGTLCDNGSVYAGLSPDGNVAMYTTPADQSGTYQWGTTGVSTGYTSLTDGDRNTTGLVSGYSTYTDSQGIYGVPAAKTCDDLVAHGYNDWYFPAPYELDVLYTNKIAIGGFDVSARYWTSRENGTGWANAKDFSDGTYYAPEKYLSYLVRCVRKGGAASPPALDFVDQTGVLFNTTITSNTITLGGDTYGMNVTCDGCTAIAKNGTWGGTTITNVNAGDTIALRLLSPSSPFVTTTVTITAGDTVGTWNVTTNDDKCLLGIAPAGYACGDYTIYAGRSPDGNVPMFVRPCDQGMSGTKGACTGTRATYRWGTYAKVTGYTSATNGDGNTAGLVANYSTYTDSQSIYGVPAAKTCANLVAYGYSDWYLPASNELTILYTQRAALGGFSTNIYWSSQERYGTLSYAKNFSNGVQESDEKWQNYPVRCVRHSGVLTYPPAFSFIDQAEVEVNTVVTSDAVTLGGNLTNMTATCGTGCTAIAKNGTWGGTMVTGFNAGDTIAIQMTSSTSFETATTATVTVGGRTSETWTVTTKVDQCVAGTVSTPGYVCGDGSIYAGLSPDGDVAMFTTPCDQGMTGTQGACTGTRGTYMWGTYGVTTGYTSSITGEANTNGLVANYGSYNDGYATGVPAAQICYDLTAHGQTDWYLPAFDELNVLYVNRIDIGGFLTDGSDYWSSRGHYLNYAYIERFSNGNLGDANKNTNHLVRCVRK